MPGSTVRKRNTSRIIGAVALAAGASLVLAACGSTKRRGSPRSPSRSPGWS
ncbi:hypothetical protein ACFWMJ_22975 [Streptomyces hawaiiensis]|uniref:hypothetical protein n=1 Tax=Streptomyces hawaiiensis TaxID=67305 RepID=UPI00364DBE44